ncbi:hypothetical protein [Asticcacaulis taihuensis]|uniref:hypothetical protein n=1 Tax=Asticcacaulis taihuensis TaxID=260084 RepID=UPI0026EB2E16|nr:hypothetical protein [Asticcacaulis taihuensis]
MKEKIRIAAAFALGIAVAVGGSALAFEKRKGSMLNERVYGFHIETIRDCNYLIVHNAQGLAVTPFLNANGQPDCGPAKGKDSYED